MRREGGVAPSDPDGPGRIDLWYRSSAGTSRPALKRVVRAGLKAFKTLTGVVVVPCVALAIRQTVLG